MTEDDKALVERLRERREAEMIGGYERVEFEDEDALAAADRIEALIAEKEAVRMEERAAIVAWMMREEKEYPSTEYNGFVAMVREEIEAGAHSK